MSLEERSTSLGSRILRAAPTRLVVDLAALAGTAAILQLGLKAVPGFSRLPNQVGFALFTALFVPAIVAVYVALVRWLERRAVTELGRQGALREVGLGLLAGAGLFTATIGGIALLGGYHVEGTEPPLVLLPPVTMAIESGMVEEILMRGVLFRILEEWLGTWAALAISAALFGLGHIANPHATVWSAVAIAIEAGTMLAAAYMLTRRLWLAIGVHAGWNYTQGGIFGVAVSGNAMKGLLRGTVSGPPWLSGGEFGAEASVLAVLVCGAAAVWLLVLAARKGEIVSPSWVRARRAAAAAGATSA